MNLSQTLYAQIDTTNYKGIFEVNEIIGNIVSVHIETKDGFVQKTLDFTISNGEVKKFCDKDGKNFSIKPNKK